VLRLLLFLQLLPLFLYGQNENGTALERSFRIAYENDLFNVAIDTPTDYYYTGGTFIEFKLPALRRNPVSKILLTLPQGRDESFGISYNNLAFTPTSIESDSILKNDRPFAGTLYLGLNRISCDSAKKMRLTSRLDLGVIGPAALAYETQKFIHARTNNLEPRGWQFQIVNDAYVNYALRLEKGLAAKNNIVELIGYASANAGTIYTNAGAGLKFRAGKMNPYFSTPVYCGKFQFWLYASAEGKVIGRDATLQGGLFNAESVYFIAPEDVQRVVGTGSAGIVVSYRRVRAEFSNTFLTREFKGGLHHTWGRFAFELVF
jgi:hypothetical protein